MGCFLVLAVTWPNLNFKGNTVDALTENELKVGKQENKVKVKGFVMD